jgi:hypothetical protein
VDRSIAAPTPHPIRRLFVLLALVACILGTTGVATPADGASSRRIAMGALSAPLNRKTTYDAFVRLTGRAPAIWALWVGWGDPQNHDLPSLSFLNHMRRKGTTPLIIWQPVISRDQGSARYRFDTIARGDHDAYLRSFAEQVGRYPGPIILRFAHEFEGWWFPWRIGLPGNTAETFTAAWRHIWEVFRGGAQPLAPNARFLWSPHGCDCPNRLKSLWPGEQYVDYIGMSVYNWAGLRRMPWRSMARLVRARMAGIALLPRKPIILAETASTHRGGNKARWISDGYRTLYSRWPRIVGVLYTNVDMGTQGVDGHTEDWRLVLPRSGTALRAYKALLRLDRFRGRIR